MKKMNWTKPVLEVLKVEMTMSDGKELWQFVPSESGFWKRAPIMDAYS